MKSESLVIADQHVAVNTFPGLVHTARHTMGVGFTRSRSLQAGRAIRRRWRHLPTTDKCGRLNLTAVSRKEVIQPHLPIRLPCYDFTPVTNPAVVIALLAVRLTTSGRTRSHGVTGGVYKTRERIHRDMLIRDY